jgi:gluconokinase
MGVSGAGKSAVGRALARRLGWAFHDADDHHSAAAKAKMARGDGLTDADREPWLRRVRQVVERHLRDETGAVIACSALRSAYRDALAHPDEPVRFLWLDVPAAVLQDRLAQRTGHFAGPSLLASQLDTLEPPTGPQAIRLAAVASLDGVVGAAHEAIEHAKSAAP